MLNLNYLYSLTMLHTTLEFPPSVFMLYGTLACICQFLSYENVMQRHSLGYSLILRYLTFISFPVKTCDSRVNQSLIQLRWNNINKGIFIHCVFYIILSCGQPTYINTIEIHTHATQFAKEIYIVSLTDNIKHF